MVEEAQTEYPREVREMYEKLNRDEFKVRLELDKISSLKEQLELVYGPPPSIPAKTGDKSPGSTASSASPGPGTGCPLSGDVMKKLADPAAILEALAQELPGARVNPTTSARWITGAGVVDKHFRVYRVTLRRLMERNPATWRAEGGGWFTHIPTEERLRAEQESLPALENETDGTNRYQENEPSQGQEQGLIFNDISP